MESFMSKIPGMSGEGTLMSKLTSGVTIIAGIVAILFGLLTAISFSWNCILAGIWTILAGALMVAIEAPFCCSFIDVIGKLSAMIKERPVWQKAGLYLCFGLVIFMFCLSVTSIFAGIAICGSAALHIVQFIGPKASQDEMKAAAASSPNPGNAEQGLAGHQTSMPTAGLTGSVPAGTSPSAPQSFQPPPYPIS